MQRSTPRRVTLLDEWLAHQSSKHPNRVESEPQPHFTTFGSFHRRLVALNQQYKLDEFRAFNPDNLAILQSLLRRLDDAVKGHLYTADELKTLITAHQLRQVQNPSFAQLRQMKDGLGVSLKQKKYVNLVSEFNGTTGASLFQLLEQRAMSSEVRAQFVAIREQWKNRSKFAEYSSKALSEIADVFNKLNQYISLLQNDVEFFKSNAIAAAYKRYTYGLTEADIAAMDGVLTQLKICTKAVCAALAAAMVERLVLVPKGYLGNLNLMEGLQFNDDVVFSTLSSLVDIRLLDASHASNFLTQSPAYQTLTTPLVRKFNEFISKYGNRNTVEKWTGLFKPSSNLASQQENSLLQDTANGDFILIPLNVPGHYELKVEQGCNCDFVYIESVTRCAVEEHKPVNLVESFLAKPKEEEAKPPLLFSIYDLGQQQRIVIPIYDYVKISIKDEKLKDLYNVVLESENPVVQEEELADFCVMHVLTAEQEIVLQRYAARFADPNIACFFAETARDLFRAASDKNIETICRQSFNMVTDQCIAMKLKSLQQQVTPDNMITEDQRLAFLRELRYKFTVTWQDDVIRDSDKFENQVLKTAEELLDGVYNQQKILQQRMVRIPADLVKQQAKRFVEEVLNLISGPHYHTLDYAVATAELNIFIKNLKLTSQEQDILRGQIKAQRNWETNKDIWFRTVETYQQFCDLKLKVVQDLVAEVRRLELSKTKTHCDTKTETKVKLLCETIAKIDAAKNRREMQTILTSLSINNSYTQNRRSHIWQVFSTPETESEKNMYKIIQSNGFGKQS